MTLVWLLCGLILIWQGSVPPAILGGSVKHYVPAQSARAIGLMLIAPFAFDLFDLLFGNPYSSDLAVSVYTLLIYIWPVIAIFLYYVYRDPRKIDSEGMLAGTDIPADYADLAQKIGRKAYSSTFYFFMSFWPGIGIIFGILGVIRATQAIRMSAEIGITAAGRLWAQVMCALIVLAALFSTVILIAFVVLVVQAPEVVGGLFDESGMPTPRPARPGPTDVPTIAPLPTFGPPAQYQIIHTPSAEDVAFGEQILMSDDLLIVTDPRATVDGHANSGYVYIYHHLGDESTPGSWQEAARLDSLPEDGAEFGTDIALSGDTLAVGAPGYGQAGAVLIYHRESADATQWSGPDVVQPFRISEGLRFGTGVALGGPSLAVVSYDEDAVTKSVLHLFYLANGKYLEKTNLAPHTTQRYTSRMEIDGNTLLVDIEDSRSNFEDLTGLYLRADEDRWIQSMDLFSTFSGPFAVSGNRLAMLRQTQKLPGDIQRSINVFEKVDSWRENSISHSVLPPPPGIDDTHKLKSIAMDGGHIAVGVPDVGFFSGVRSVIYLYNPSGPMTVLRIAGGDPNTQTAFGDSVAIRGPFVAAGSPTSKTAVVFFVPELLADTANLPTDVPTPTLVPTATPTITPIPLPTFPPITNFPPASPPSEYCKTDELGVEIKGDSYACFVSQPGDPAGQGKNWIMTSDDAQLLLENKCNIRQPVFDEVKFRLRSPALNEEWFVFLDSPQGVRLTAGIYEKTVSGIPEEPGIGRLQVIGEGGRCGLNSTGRFEILQTGCEPNAASPVFVATFEHHCEDIVPALLGYIHVPISRAQ